MKKDKRSLDVPIHVTLRTEIWRGLSVQDFLRTLLRTALYGIGCFLLVRGGVMSVLTTLIVVIFLAGLTGIYYQRFETNLSPKDYLRIALKHLREQKRYYSVFRKDGDNQ